ncbi:putative phage resistance domain protein [Mycobacterium xenopi 3993]|nr:putative phage resistance domain protein [Mycobacterium xenopi 3993]
MLQDHIDGISPPGAAAGSTRPGDLRVGAAAQAGLVRGGQRDHPPPLGRLRPSIELRAEELPAQQAWDDARANASKLFGYTMPRTYLTGANVAEFAAQVRAKASEAVTELGHLIDQLQPAHSRLGSTPGADDRLTVAVALRGFVENLSTTTGNVAVIDAMAAVTLPVAIETAGQIRNDAARDARALRNFKWPLLQTLRAGPTGRARPATARGRSNGRCRTRSPCRAAR